ncbi:MAG: hypothetical protein CAPSK01_003940 [Candidatus Accumulibacter vicinus]|uniref:Uncharacterized protein n=1 Tax=Candidatus Accumulibacter vicinus TaxID=2954382 RepID=A0A084XX05_9PROT|nr:MAG: hypothetical protein CAPSK01_003940 [Candidatus Accumulibacter vicinus]
MAQMDVAPSRRKVTAGCGHPCIEAGAVWRGMPLIAISIAWPGRNAQEVGQEKAPMDNHLRLPGPDCRPTPHPAMAAAPARRASIPAMAARSA